MQRCVCARPQPHRYGMLRLGYAPNRRLAASRTVVGVQSVLETGGDWIVLRTAGRSTLPLANSLGEDGFRAWAPSATYTIVNRMKTKVPVTVPMLPGFVFAGLAHLAELLDLSRMEEKSRRGSVGQLPAHRDFSILRHNGAFAIIADRELNPLREREAAAIPRTALPQFRRGASVRITRGVYEGIVGRVERCDQGYALIMCDDWKRPAKIPTWLLREDDALSANHQVPRAA